MNGSGGLHTRQRIVRKIFNFLISLLAIVLTVAISLSVIPAREVIQRVRYVWSDGGVETWENAAIEEGIHSDIEEYYYDNLPEELREVYREVYVHIMRNEDEGPLYSSVNVDDFWKTYYAVLADHPEIFWMDMNAHVQESGITKKVLSYQFETTMPAESRVSMLQNIEDAADACIDQIPADASDYEKIKYVYEYIIDLAEYDSTGVDNQNIQSVLLYHRSVCAGYAKTFQYILNRMGMFCAYITGTIRDGGIHGWNMVRIDGQYYYVDVTWGDPVFANQVDNRSDRVMNYNYLCCTESDLFKTHVPDGTVPLPSCTLDNYNYYIMNNKYYEDFDHDTIYNKVMESVWSGETSIVMKFGSDEAFEQAKYSLFEDGLLSDAGQYLMDINGVNTWNYRYHTDEAFNLITIYWS